MKSTNITLNKKTWGVAISDSTSANDAVILTHEEIMADLPELLRHSAVADAIKKIVAKGIRNFASIELPMVGTGKVAVKMEKPLTANPDGIKTLLLANVSRDLFSTSIYNALIAARIDSVYKLAMIDLADVAKLRTMGKKSVDAVKNFIESNQLNDEELLRKLTQKENAIDRTECIAIPEVASSKAFKDLVEMTKPVEDIEHITLEKLYGGGRSTFFNKAFPYRYDTDKNFVRTKYEENFPKDSDRELLKSMAIEVGKILQEYTDIQMRTYIKEM